MTNQVKTTAIISADIEHMLDTTKRTSEMSFGHDSDWWNSAMLVCLTIAAIAAVGVVITTLAVVRAQKMEARAASDELERYKASVALKVAEAKKEGVEAGKTAAGADLRAAEAHKQAAEATERAAAAREGAAEADARAAKANERAAALEKEAQTARLEQERLKATLAWRVISNHEATALQNALAAHPGSVNLWFTQGDPESMYLAIQFSTILQNAHWTVLSAGATLAGIVFGIAAPDANSVDAISLRAALHGAGFSFSTDPLPPWQSTIGATRNVAFPTLMIGSRRPAVFQ